MSSKLTAAQAAISALLPSLRASDAFGLVVFHEQAREVVPLQVVGEPVGAFYSRVVDRVSEIQVGGGTKLLSGMELATKMMLQQYGANTTLEKRLVLITDMQDTSEDAEGPDALFALGLENAKRAIYSTYIGVGVDFNTEVSRDCRLRCGFDCLID
mgnify:FL=1